MRASSPNSPQRLVTVFIGSGRKKRGATYAAARRFLDNLAAHGDVQGEIVFLSEHNLGLCRGCKVCFERGKERCPLGGDRDLLLEKMSRSDGVVFASPNYSFQVSAVMKSFLDRLGFLFHRPRFHGKTFSSIVVQGFYGGEKIEKYLKFVGSGLGFTSVKGSCLTALEPMTDRERRKWDKALARQSRRFYRQLQRPAHATPTLFQLMVFRMARTSIKLMLTEDSRDYSYYRDQGWFDAAYYYPTPLNPLKRALGAAFDWVFTRIYRRKAPAPQLTASATELSIERSEQ